MHGNALWNRDAKNVDANHYRTNGKHIHRGSKIYCQKTSSQIQLLFVLKMAKVAYADSVEEFVDLLQGTHVMDFVKRDLWASHMTHLSVPDPIKQFQFYKFWFEIKDNQQTVSDHPAQLKPFKTQPNTLDFNVMTMIKFELYTPTTSDGFIVNRYLETETNKLNQASSFKWLITEFTVQLTPQYILVNMNLKARTVLTCLSTIRLAPFCAALWKGIKVLPDKSSFLVQKMVGKNSWQCEFVIPHSFGDPLECIECRRLKKKLEALHALTCPEHCAFIKFPIYTKDMLALSEVKCLKKPRNNTSLKVLKRLQESFEDHLNQSARVKAILQAPALQHQDNTVTTSTTTTTSHGGSTTATTIGEDFSTIEHQFFTAAWDDDNDEYHHLDATSKPGVFFGASTPPSFSQLSWGNFTDSEIQL